MNVSTGVGVDVKDREMVFIKSVDTNFTVEMVVHNNDFFDTRASLPLQVRYLLR